MHDTDKFMYLNIDENNLDHILVIYSAYDPTLILETINSIRKTKRPTLLVYRYSFSDTLENVKNGKLSYE